MESIVLLRILHTEEHKIKKRFALGHTMYGVLCIPVLVRGHQGHAHVTHPKVLGSLPVLHTDFGCCLRI